MLVDRLERGARPQSRERAEVAVEACLRHVTRKKSRTRADTLSREIPKSFRPCYNLRCENLTRSHVWAATDRAPTEGMANHLRSYNRTF